MIVQNWYMFFLLAFASFRLTRLFVFDKITQFIRNWFIEEVSIKGETYLKPKSGVFLNFMGQLLSCYWCTGVWCSAFLYALFVFYPTVAVPLIMILAIAGVASIIETIVSKIIE